MSVDSRDRRPLRLVHVMTVDNTLLFFRGQVAFMREHGVEPAMVCSPGPRTAEFEARFGVPVVSIPMRRAISPLADLVAVARLVRTFRRLRPEVVHSHTPKGGLLGTLAAWLARVPARIYHVRGLPLETATGRRAMLLRATERLSCLLAHRVLCVSGSVREVMVRERLCPPDKVRVPAYGTGNGVDAEGRYDPAQVAPGTGAAVRARFGIPEGAPVVLFVGRIVRDKGVQELAEAWRRLSAEHPEAHLLVVGPFEPQDPVDSGTESLLRTHPSVHLAGLDWDTVPYYAAADVIAFPTYREGFPNVPLEAAAMRIPVVATAVPGCVDAVEDGRTGTLVPPRDAAALAEALARYLRDPALRALHGRTGRERVLERYRPAYVWRALLAEYAGLARERRLGWVPAADVPAADVPGAVPAGVP